MCAVKKFYMKCFSFKQRVLLLWKLAKTNFSCGHGGGGRGRGEKERGGERDREREGGREGGRDGGAGEREKKFCLSTYV